MIKFSQQERLDLIERLDQKNLFLRTLWNLTEIYYTDDVSTAAVEIVNDQLRMVFNKTFWDSLPSDAQLFVVCHEQLHLILDHFERMRFGEGDGDLKNKAADVAINHLLIRMYYFEQSMIPNWEQYCWTTTVFPDQNVTDNETAEYYYALLKQRTEANKDIGGKPIDDHTYGDKPARVPKNIKEAIKEAAKEVTQHCNSNSQTCKEVSDGAEISGQDQQYAYKRKPKPSWKRVYKRIPKRILAAREQTHWLFPDRNQQLILSGISLPGAFEVDHANRVNVRVYLDSSGSCVEDSRYFLQSALSLPVKLFNVQLYGFHGKIYEIDPKPPYNLRGFGSTSFQAIADHVEQAKGTVDAVMVFTDGYAPGPRNRSPKKWHWFITPDGSANYISDQPNIYMLKDFDWKS